MPFYFLSGQGKIHRANSQNKKSDRPCCNCFRPRHTEYIALDKTLPSRAGETEFRWILHMSSPKFRAKFLGGIFYLEFKLEFQISFNRWIWTAERIDNEVNVRWRLSFSKRTTCRLIIETELYVKWWYIENTPSLGNVVISKESELTLMRFQSWSSP